jgi:hypothetical protein
MLSMHTPSLITPLVANEIKRDVHITRSRGARLRFRRRSAASRAFVPRGRTTVPPFAH